MAQSTIPSPEFLRQLISYDPETGLMTWRSRTPDMFKEGNRGREANCATWNAQNAGKPAFATDKGDGYLVGKIYKRGFFAHRVAWAIYHGAWPVELIDHINGIRNDNRITNLREASHELNTRNASVRRNTKSGHLGVRWINCNRYAGYRVSIGVDGKKVHVGIYKTIDAAIKARKSAEAKYGYPDGNGRPKTGY